MAHHKQSVKGPGAQLLLHRTRQHLHRTHTHTCTCTLMCTHVCVHGHTPTCIHIHTCTCAYTHVFTNFPLEEASLSGTALGLCRVFIPVTSPHEGDGGLAQLPPWQISGSERGSNFAKVTGQAMGGAGTRRLGCKEQPKRKERLIPAVFPKYFQS